MDNLKKYVTNFYEAIDRKDYTTMRALLDPKHSFTNAMTPEPLDVKGHIDLVENLNKAMTGKHIIDTIVSDGHEWVCTRGHWTGTHTGEFNGVPATNKPITFTWLNLRRVVKDKTVEEYLEMNPASVMQQIGATTVNA